VAFEGLIVFQHEIVFGFHHMHPRFVTDQFLGIYSQYTACHKRGNTQEAESVFIVKRGINPHPRFDREDE
jgi:hypothetical protein